MKTLTAQYEALNRKAQDKILWYLDGYKAKLLPQTISYNKRNYTHLYYNDRGFFISRIEDFGTVSINIKEVHQLLFVVADLLT